MRKTVPLPCQDLRTKTIYYGRGEETPEIVDGSDTALYWCLRTMLPIGPDGEEARPDLCGRGRPCCDPPRPAS
jgi:hypothetical protein